MYSALTMAYGKFSPVPTETISFSNSQRFLAFSARLNDRLLQELSKRRQSSIHRRYNAVGMLDWALADLNTLCTHTHTHNTYTKLRLARLWQRRRSINRPLIIYLDYMTNVTSCAVYGTAQWPRAYVTLPYAGHGHRIPYVWKDWQPDNGSYWCVLRRIPYAPVSVAKASGEMPMWYYERYCCSWCFTFINESLNE